MPDRAATTRDKGLPRAARRNDRRQARPSERAHCKRLCGRRTPRAKRHVACGEQDLRRHGGCRGPCRGPEALRRELRPGSARQDRRALDARFTARVAPDRAAAGQQDARRRRALRLGPFGRSPEDRRTAERAAARVDGAAFGLPAGQHQRRGDQERAGAGRGRGRRTRRRRAAAPATARLDGDPPRSPATSKRSACRTVPCASFSMRCRATASRSTRSRPA